MCIRDRIKTSRPGPSIYERVVPPLKTAWENSVGGKAATQPYLRARLSGWPARLTVDPTELPAADRAFLERLARDTWRGLVALSDRAHGVPLDTVRLNGSLMPERAWVGDYTNVTNIGLYLIDIVAARELGPVSYTHLDVYKRQPVELGAAASGDPFGVRERRTRPGHLAFHRGRRDHHGRQG